ncbi:MAG: hypothetical protein KKA31_02170 [Candidatus Margulisbacteria bacterium]|nr:hypothetical protein [Candidatus Margulisiibacteriota bacterium]
MLNAVQAISGYSGADSVSDSLSMRILESYQSSGAAATTDKQKAQEQFLAIFYKEILKQTFKAPSFSISKDEDASLSKVFSSDLMVEQMAIELAKNGAFSAQDIMPVDIQKVEQ